MGMEGIPACQTMILMYGGVTCGNWLLLLSPASERLLLRYSAAAAAAAAAACLPD
jgi:hypothetical protein